MMCDKLWKSLFRNFDNSSKSTSRMQDMMTVEA